MKTKALIKHTALELFNAHGVMNITLRDVAAALNKSYGNITYHYNGKEVLIQEMYEDMQAELDKLGEQFKSDKALLSDILQAPKSTFNISLRYRFFFTDYLELNRHFPLLMLQVQAQQQQRMAYYAEKLLQLQQMGLLRSDLTVNSLSTLMQLSGLVRTFFFVQWPKPSPDLPSLESQYCQQVNEVLWPYLSPNGLRIYDQFQQELHG